MTTTRRRFPFEIALTRITLALTLLAVVGFLHAFWQTLSTGSAHAHAGDVVIFLVTVSFFVYGNVTYQMTRLGHFRRSREHVPAAREALEEIYDGQAPTLAFLVPSYKEEERIVRQTLLSAALQEYPGRCVVLLIDDPYRFDDPEALRGLSMARALVADLDAMLRHAAATFITAQQGFLERQSRGALSMEREAATIAELYDRAAEWLERKASEVVVTDHTDAFFTESVLRAPARAHRERAQEWRERTQASTVAALLVRREYERLASLFCVRLTSFERKRYANLSHEPNKAMNLNTYIGLMGGCYKEEMVTTGVGLVAASPMDTTLVIQDATYLITLDADSLLLPGYALRLVHVMESPGGERIAVAQTPYSAIPGPARLLERIAGATTDIQYLVHQGFTQHRATFWVGANALLRRAALDEIAVDVDEGGRRIRRYIQDRTVIEDTESTVDLIDKGWTLFNYPERLAYSATPPDFGSLVVQRGRWANGGLIILPKLVRYLLRGPDRMHRLREGFFRLHYLTSIAGVSTGFVLLLAYPFPDQFQDSWLPLTAMPYFLLYARDLWQAGYRQAADILRVYALNLLLLPVNLAGVMRSLHQAWKGHRIPFHRTPKVAGRTRTPARYLVAVVGIAIFCLVFGVDDAVHGLWAQAAFGLLNGTLFLYAIRAFIGFREACDDATFGLRARLRGLPRPTLSGKGIS